ncbi:MAG: ABC transporter permease [Azospirillaceae bacterium]
MGAYLVRRLLQALLVIAAVVFVVAMLVKLVPGDIVDMMAIGNPAFTEEDAERVREELGMNRSVVEHFVVYTAGLFEGELGNSIRHRQPAATLIAERLPATIELTVVAMIFALVLAIPIGVITAIKQGSVVDQVGTALATLGVAIPGFLLGILMIMLFTVELGWLPPSGRSGSVVVALYHSVVELDPGILWESLRYFLMPAAALAASIVAINSRLIRSTMLDVIRQDYIQFVRAKGAPTRVVYIRHALRNALIPSVTILGLQLGFLISGAFIIENVFAWPGLGRLAVEAILWRDLPLIQATVLVSSIIFVALSITVDLVYRFLDPRIDYARR